VTPATINENAPVRGPLPALEALPELERLLRQPQPQPTAAAWHALEALLVALPGVEPLLMAEGGRLAQLDPMLLTDPRYRQLRAALEALRAGGELTYPLPVDRLGAELVAAGSTDPGALIETCRAVWAEYPTALGLDLARGVELLARRRAVLEQLEAAAAEADALGILSAPRLTLVPEPDPDPTPGGERVAVVRSGFPTHSCDMPTARGAADEPVAERCPNPVRVAFHYAATSTLRILPAACRRKRCAVCGAQRVREHLTPVAVDMAADGVAWRLELELAEWTAVRQQLRRAGADYKRMPAADDRLVVWASGPVSGAERVAEPVEQLRADLEASLAVPGRITSSRRWQRVAEPVETLEPEAELERETIGVLTVSMPELRRVVRERGHVNPISVETDERGAEPIHPMDRIYSTVMARENVDRLLAGLVRNPLEGVADDESLRAWADELDRRRRVRELEAVAS